MSPSSIVWFLLLGSGGIILAISNIRYNRARDREYEAFKKALRLLKPELSNNLDHAMHMQSVLANNQIPTETFETTIWTAVLAGNLLSRLDEETTKRFTDIYDLVKRAERCKSEINAASRSKWGLERWGQLDEQRRTLLTNTLEQLTASLRKTLARAHRLAST